MNKKARTPWFPTYSRAQALLKRMEGVQEQVYKHMNASIGEHMGTPQSQVDWSEPDVWIPKRLHGADQELATHLWTGGSEKLNPRYTEGEMHLARNHGLLDVDGSGKYRLTAVGKSFVADDAKTLRTIDEEEGITHLLSVLATLGSAQRKDIVEPWMTALAPGGDGRSKETMGSKLGDRLSNALERGLLEKQGIKYTLTPKGEKYVGSAVKKSEAAKLILDQALKQHRDEQRARVRELLHQMHHYRFEHLIRDLLEKMGYSNVEVTKQSSDGGIDVVAEFSAGVTSFREAIQVKRLTSNVSSDVVDALRGSLHKARALKGTIFTTSGFTKAALAAATPENVVPITLVPGDKLIDLLVEHELGISLTKVELITGIDEAVFSPHPMSEAEKTQE
ncbi:restriction endonuclease [Deinococcus taklimakanensis]|uniref:Restriction endonuclease n=1 Tax=Deinococcus taklimakanensis TaxID=536443 RepID=A0ABW5P0Z0_9DEIO